MGVGVVGSLWPERLDTAGVVPFHATAAVPDGVRHGTPVQAHVALGDPFAPEDQLAVFRHTAAAAAGADVTLHTYAGQVICSPIKNYPTTTTAQPRVPGGVRTTYWRCSGNPRAIDGVGTRSLFQQSSAASLTIPAT
jgi:hypothetical protein